MKIYQFLLHSLKWNLLKFVFWLFFIYLISLLFKTPIYKFIEIFEIKKNKSDLIHFKNALDNNSSEDCRKIKKEIFRDNCYYNLNSRQIVYYSSKNFCPLIKSQVLGFLCQRSQYRPHLTNFLTSFYTKNKKLKTINKKSQSFLLFLNLLIEKYLKNYSSVKQSSADALNICENLKDSFLIDECKYFLSLKAFFNLIKNNYIWFSTISDLCNRISNKDFRSECFYTFADEFGLKEQENFTLLAAKLCIESNKAANWLCIDHVARRISHTSILNLFCRAADPEDEFKCLQNLGTRTYKKPIKKFFYRSLQECRNININDFTNNCLKGLAYETGFMEYENSKSIKEVCSMFPNRIKLVCFKGIIRNIREKFINFPQQEKEKLFLKCETVDKKFIEETCSEFLAGFLNDLAHEKNYSEIEDFCKNLKKRKWKKECLIQLENIKERY